MALSAIKLVIGGIQVFVGHPKQNLCQNVCHSLICVAAFQIWLKNGLNLKEGLELFCFMMQIYSSTPQDHV